MSITQNNPGIHLSDTLYFNVHLSEMYTGCMLAFSRLEPDEDTHMQVFIWQQFVSTALYPPHSELWFHKEEDDVYSLHNIFYF